MITKLILCTGFVILLSGGLLILSGFATFPIDGIVLNAGIILLVAGGIMLKGIVYVREIVN